MITAKDLIAKFQQALKDDWGYIWGTAGVKWTEARQKQIEQTTDADRAQARKYGSKWIGHMVADCSGLFTWAFRQLGGDMYHGSNTMYLKWCINKGELKNGKRTDGAVLKPGTAVFCWNGSTYSHVGLYIGDGWVIEAANTQSGVIKTKVTESKWKFWGELKGLSFDEKVPEPEPEPAKTYPLIKRGSKGEAVKECQTMLQTLGYDLGKWGIDGDFGSATEKAVIEFQRDHLLVQDGKVGNNTWAALIQAVNKIEPKPETKYTVTIRGLDKKTADEIVKKYGGSVRTE